MRQLPRLCRVALRKESVDRNRMRMFWAKYGKVALRKESVDRNAGEIVTRRYYLRRSPQGERG